MSTKMLLAVASVIALGSATSAVAQQQEYDRTGDHMYSYGPTVHQSAPSETRTTRTQTPTPTSYRFDPTPDHLYYYGPLSAH